MPNTKISALTAAAALTGTEELPVVQSAATVKATPAQIKTFTSASPTLVTPALGTPTSGTLSNCTGLPAAGVVGTAAVLGANSFTATQTITPAANTSAVVVASHTHTTSNPAVDVAQTWNAGAVTFTGWKLNITNTASAAASLLMDLQVGGTSLVGVDKAGKYISNIAANAKWFSGQYAGSEYIFLGYDSVGYGIFGGSATGAGGFKVGSTPKIYSAGNVQIGTASAELVVFNVASNTTPAVSVPDVGLTTKPAFEAAMNTASTAKAFRVTKNAAETMHVTATGDIVAGLHATGAAAPTIASAATIAPTTSILFVSGTTNVVTITPPSPISAGGGTITIIPTGLWATTTAGNIALATTAVVNRALTMTYDVTTTKWYPSY